MASRARLLWLAGPVALLAACDGGTSGSSGPGAVSEGEARALDEAAEMLEERRLPDGALPTTGDGATQDGATGDGTNPDQPTPDMTNEGTAEAE